MAPEAKVEGSAVHPEPQRPGASPPKVVEEGKAFAAAATDSARARGLKQQDAPKHPTEELPTRQEEKDKPDAVSATTRLPAIIVTLVAAAVAALSIWYLVRPVPLLVQGEVDATRFDIASRVDGRVAEEFQ